MPLPAAPRGSCGRRSGGRSSAASRTLPRRTGRRFLAAEGQGRVRLLRGVPTRTRSGRTGRAAGPTAAGSASSAPASRSWPRPSPPKACSCPSTGARLAPPGWQGLLARLTGMRYDFAPAAREDRPPDARVYRLNRPDAWGESAHGFRLVANTTPRDEHGWVRTFEDLAEGAQGLKKVGVLRMDVDDLGRVLTQWLRGSNPGQHLGAEPCPGPLLCRVAGRHLPGGAGPARHERGARRPGGPAVRHLCRGR